MRKDFMKAPLFPFPHPILYPVDMTATQSLDLTSQLKISLDLLIIQDAETVYNSHRAPRHPDDLFRFQVQVFLVPNREYYGIRTL